LQAARVKVDATQNVTPWFSGVQPPRQFLRLGRGALLNWLGRFSRRSALRSHQIQPPWLHAAEPLPRVRSSKRPLPVLPVVRSGFWPPKSRLTIAFNDIEIHIPSSRNELLLRHRAKTDCFCDTEPKRPSQAGRKAVWTFTRVPARSERPPPIAADRLPRRRY